MSSAVNDGRTDLIKAIHLAPKIVQTEGFKLLVTDAIPVANSAVTWYAMYKTPYVVARDPNSTSIQQVVSTPH